jgi:hypothetical protein
VLAYCSPHHITSHYLFRSLPPADTTFVISNRMPSVEETSAAKHQSLSSLLLYCLRLTSLLEGHGAEPWILSAHRLVKKQEHDRLQCLTGRVVECDLPRNSNNSNNNYTNARPLLLFGWFLHLQQGDRRREAPLWAPRSPRTPAPIAGTSAART